MRVPAFVLLLSLPLLARAESPFPARSGETGYLDVPDANVVGRARGMLAAELRFDQPADAPGTVGPLPVYVVAGILSRLDLGLSMREWGQPGDPYPGRMAYGVAGKLQLVAGSTWRPSVAIGANLDRFNTRPLGTARLIASTEIAPGLDLAAFAGGEKEFSPEATSGPVFGGALAYSLTRRFSMVVEGLSTPRGENLGGALRWTARPTLGFQLAFNYLPADGGFRVSLGVAVRPPEPRRVRAPTGAIAAAVLPPTLAGPPEFKDPGPRFRLRMPTAGALALGAPRRLQYGPYTGPAMAAVAPRPASVAPAKAAAPTLEELAEAQVREQEALADAREKRVRSTSDQLDAREKAALENARRLEERERELTAREQQLDARQQRTAIRTAPTQQQRQLESLETQLAAQERQLLAQERSLAPAIDAARGREKDSGIREEVERQEANRLAASVGAAASTGLQVELRKQALAARNRQLAALEAKLVAKGERLDAFERQLRAKGERLDAWSRRLDTRAERLDLLEKRAAETRPAAPKPVEPPKPAGEPRDKAVFVMVVKSPTAIVKERAAGPAAPQAGAALHPGVAVEKAVAAATVISFPTPASQISELDRETLDNIARLAAKERCELLIWARAKDPGLMSEAQRRADEIKTRAIAAGPLDARQVVTRITTRPGAQGVDVVVSALRETARPAAAAPAAGAPAAAALLAGESGKRQVREAVVAAQPSIEACIGEHIEQRKLQRAEGVLKLTVSTQGRVSKVTTAGGDLAGGSLEECLNAAAGAWAFPAADAEYVVDVPITVMRGGATR